jgi:hypothetical protein
MNSNPAVLSVFNNTGSIVKEIPADFTSSQDSVLAKLFLKSSAEFNFEARGPDIFSNQGLVGGSEFLHVTRSFNLMKKDNSIAQIKTGSKFADVVIEAKLISNATRHGEICTL